MTSGPDLNVTPESAIERLNIFLDKFMLPFPVRFLTNRVVILATLATLIPLLFYTANQAFVNSLNSYLNVMSVVVSSTVLLYATIADVRDRAAAQNANEIAKAYEELLESRVIDQQEEVKKRIQYQEDSAKAYERVLEKRVQADHLLIEQILHNSVENILSDRLENIRTEDHKQLEQMQKAVVASNESLRIELAEKAVLASNELLRSEISELRELVLGLHQNQFPPSQEPSQDSLQ